MFMLLLLKNKDLCGDLWSIKHRVTDCDTGGITWSERPERSERRR